MMARLVGCGTWLLPLLCLAAPPGHAQWQPNGIPVTNALRGQDSPHITSDGAGGAIVVWRDFRNFYATDYDLYAQRLTAEGKIALGWPADGFPVCTDSAYQDEPQIVSDGVGGVYVTWIDRRNGMTPPGIDHIYLQRITAAGAVAPGWTPNGIPVCPTPGDQNAPQLAPDGAGGMFVVWEDFRRGLPNEYNGQVDMYAQRILSDGTVAGGWPIDGLPVCTAPGARLLPSVMPDGVGGFFVTWDDGRSPESLFDIYALRVTAEGRVAQGWIADGVPVCTAPNHQGLTALVTDDQGGFIVAWQDLRSEVDIYAQHLTADGAVAPGWIKDGVPVCTAPDLQYEEQIVSDGAGGAIIMWSDYRNYDLSAADLYAQRILASGKIAPGWPVDGMTLSQARYWQLVPSVVADGSGGALVAYETTNGVQNLYVQHVTASGTLAPGWKPDVPLCVVPGIHAHPAAVSDGMGGMIVAWEDARDSTGYIIYAHHVTGDLPTAARVSLVSAEAAPGRVVLSWFSAERLSGIVYRRDESSDWVPRGHPRDAGNGIIMFEDSSVSEGRYAYRLGFASDAGELFTPEVWVTVPGKHVLALAGFSPNPAVGSPLISLSLASGQHARLEVFDASGREVVTKDVGSLGPGRHVVDAGREVSLASGVYWVRLTQAGRSLTARGVVVR